MSFHARIPTPSDLERIDTPDTSMKAAVAALVDTLQQYREKIGGLERQTQQLHAKLEAERQAVERLKSRNHLLLRELATKAKTKRRKPVNPDQIALPF